MQNQEYEIDLMELAIYFCHRWKKILLCAVAGLAIGFAIGARTAAVSYTATARFVVSALSSTASSSSTSKSAKSNYAGDAGSLLGESLTVDSSSDESTESVNRYSSFGDSADVALYAGDIVKNDVVLQPVIDSLALDATCSELAGCIDTESVGKGPILQIKVTRKDEQQALAICQKITEIAPAVIESTTDISEITPISEPAVMPEKTQSPTRKAMLGGLLGAVLAGGVLLMCYLFNTKIRKEEEIVRVLGAKVLGVIPVGADGAAKQGKKLCMPELTPNEQTPFAEAFKALRTNLEFYAAEQDIHTLLFAAPEADDSQRTFLQNLAQALHSAGHTVLLADLDLRTAAEAPGVCEILSEKADVEKAIRHGAQNGVDLLPAGAACSDPAALFSRGDTAALLASLREKYDFVLLNAPNVNEYTDAVVLSRVADAAVLLLAAGHTGMPAAQKCLEKLKTVNARVQGAVLTHYDPKNL